MGKGRIKAEPVDPAKSIAARIRTAMAACGMKSVAELGAAYRSAPSDGAPLDQRRHQKHDP